jgi:hypothetical protein
LVKFDRTKDAKAALAHFQGLEFIHNSPVVYHGAVNIQNCVIDSRWLVKWIGYGVDRFLPPPSQSFNTDEHQSSKRKYLVKIVPISNYFTLKILFESLVQYHITLVQYHITLVQYHETLVQYHKAPELLRGQFDTNVPSQLKAVDIYGLGMILYQVHTREPLFCDVGKTPEGTYSTDT